MRTNVGRRPGPGLRALARAAFGTGLGALMDGYQAAMGVAAVQLPGRRTIMEAHSAYPGFRAIAVTAPPVPVPTVPAPAVPAPAREPGTEPPGAAGETGRGPGSGTGIAFAYGFHGDSGQWRHDLVRSALMAQSGP